MTKIRSLRYTRNLFLRAVCVVYLSAFLSFYFQAPGLFGDNGVLPAKSLLENSRYKTLKEKIHYQPTLLWLAPYLELSTSAAIDVLSLLGAFLAFTGIVSQKFCIVPVFTALWSLFFSLYQVGQVFFTNNYDELLLEVGFIAIFMAPFLPSRRKMKTPTSDSISFWLCRLLLFRILFTAGLGKFLSGCPKWWTLSALNHHFETMPLPNPLSWYAHQLPTWVLRLSTVYTNICELVIPFLFFLPIRSARISAFHLQLFLQTCIVATGNFGHANILIVTLLLSLLDDSFFYGSTKPNSKLAILGKTLNVGILAGIVFGAVKLYNIKYIGGILEAQIGFTKIQFNSLVEQALPVIVLLLLVSVFFTIFTCLYQVLESNYSGNKAIGVIGALLYGVVALAICFSSSAALLTIHPKTNSTIPPLQRTAFNRMAKAHIVNQYNLFPKITGIDGRPEIVLEGANNVEGPWKEYNLLYKPGNINHSLSFIAPFSPRLDWQFYWAAQTTYDKQPWLLSLTHRLLTAQPEVLNLIDHAHSPFPNPPKYIRASLYKYKFTTWSRRNQPAWWVRERVSEYFPAYSKDSPALEDYLKARNLLPAVSGKSEEVNPVWKQGLEVVRVAATKFDATLLFWSVLTAAFAIVVTTAGWF